MRVALRVVLGVVATVLAAWALLEAHAAYDRHRQAVMRARLDHAEGAWRAWAHCVVGPEAFEEPCRRRLGYCSVGETAAESARRLAEDRARIRERVALELATRRGRGAAGAWLDPCASLPGPTDEDRETDPSLAEAWDAARDRVEAWRASGAPDLVEDERALAEALVAADAELQWDTPPPPARHEVPAERWPGYVLVTPVDRRRDGDEIVLALRHPTRGALRCRLGGELSCEAPAILGPADDAWPDGAPSPPPALGGTEGEAEVDVVCPLGSDAWAITRASSDGTDVAIGRDGWWTMHGLGAADRVQGCMRDALVAFRTARTGDQLTITRTLCTTAGCRTDDASVDVPESDEEIRVVDLGPTVALFTQPAEGPLRARVARLAALASTETVVVSLEPGRALGEVVVREGVANVLDARSVTVQRVEAAHPAASACDRDEFDDE